MKKTEYNRKYHLERYHKLRLDIFAKLGNQCTKCGKKEDLQVDHINPTTKKFQIGRLWGIAKEKLEEELAKCQLLCSDCHRNKTFTNGDGGKFYVKCGTYSSYRYGCRCIDCKNAEKEQRKNWK